MEEAPQPNYKFFNFNFILLWKSVYLPLTLANEMKKMAYELRQATFIITQCTHVSWMRVCARCAKEVTHHLPQMNVQTHLHLIYIFLRFQNIGERTCLSTVSRLQFLIPFYATTTKKKSGAPKTSKNNGKIISVRKRRHISVAVQV